jgi:hypothetical protein
MSMHSTPALREHGRYPMQALTARELKDYRRALEGSLRGLPEHAPIRERLHVRLTEVMAEINGRAQLQQACGQ